MEEVLNRIEADVENRLNDGYSIKCLNPIDKVDFSGYVWGVAMAENAFHNYVTDLDKKSVFDKIKNEVADEFWGEMYRKLIFNGIDLVHSLIDAYTDEEYEELMEREKERENGAK